MEHKPWGALACIKRKKMQRNRKVFNDERLKWSGSNQFCNILWQLNKLQVHSIACHILKLTNLPLSGICDTSVISFNSHLVMLIKVFFFIFSQLKLFNFLTTNILCSKLSWIIATSSFLLNLLKYYTNMLILNNHLNIPTAVSIFNH